MFLFLIIYFLFYLNIYQFNCFKIYSNYSTRIIKKQQDDDNYFSPSLIKNFQINSKILLNKFNQHYYNKKLKKVLQNDRKLPVKLKKYQFNNDLTRNKFFPMSAAAYANEENILLCLNKTFKNSELYNVTKVACNGHQSQICAAFVALSHDDKAIILSFRGTNSFTQLMLESSEIVFTKQTEWFIGGKVATYFTEIYQQLSSEGLINSVLNLIKIYKDYELWVTGHSLGGALASLAAAEICSSGLIKSQNIKLLTLGQPRTGDWVWAAAMDQLLPYYNYRVVNYRDVIVHLPIRYFEGYQHYRTEVWYNNGMDDIDDEDDFDDFIICDDMDEDDDNCSNSLWFYRTSHHRNYFGYKVEKYGRNGCLND